MPATGKTGNQPKSYELQQTSRTDRMATFLRIGSKFCVFFKEFSLPLSGHGNEAWCPGNCGINETGNTEGSAVLLAPHQRQITRRK